MTAIHMHRGEHVGTVPTGGGDRVRHYPVVKNRVLPPLGGDVTFAGPLLTKTLLINPLTAGGLPAGPRLVAYDKADGRELASVDLPGAAIGTPMTYLVDGQQHIALTVQGARQGDVPELVAVALR